MRGHTDHARSLLADACRSAFIKRYACGGRSELAGKTADPDAVFVMRVTIMSTGVNPYQSTLAVLFDKNRAA